MKATVRELVRHTLYATSLDHLLLRRRRARGQDVGYLDAPDRRQVFAEIYDRGIWLTEENADCLSGAGSSLRSTAQLREALPALLTRLGATSLLDLGCGDFTWMRHVDLGVPYVGVDIVPGVVEANRRQHATPQRTFHCLDAVSEPLPAADAVLCREVLFHLSLADARRVLDNVGESGARYLIATTDEATGFNSDIKTGDFRVLNLRRRPFSFPAPLCQFADDAVQAGRVLGVWRTADL
ncbi:methyltransferase [Micromonospora sp. NPDC002575]|uniref:methyltransferase n=1 Tax=Micromonospora sp. NPDC002575 TaxID=3364222 RepID=UPI003673E11D